MSLPLDQDQIIVNKCLALIWSFWHLKAKIWSRKSTQRAAGSAGLKLFQCITNKKHDRQKESKKETKNQKESKKKRNKATIKQTDKQSNSKNRHKNKEKKNRCSCLYMWLDVVLSEIKTEWRHSSDSYHTDFFKPQPESLSILKVCANWGCTILGK